MGLTGAKEVLRRSGTTAEHAVFTGAVSELTYDSDKKAIRVHDASEAGGWEVAHADTRIKSKNKGVYFPSNSGSIADHGAVSGSYYDAGNLKNVLDDIGADDAIIELPAGTYTVITDLTIPANVQLRFQMGAVISAVGDVTINGRIDAPPNQIFSGAGSVVFGRRAALNTHVEWFGSVGTSNDTAAFESWLAAVKTVSARLCLCNETYTLIDWDMSVSGGLDNAIVVEGVSNGQGNAISPATENGSLIKAGAGATYAIRVGSSADITVGVTFSNLTVDGNARNSNCIELYDATFAEFKNVVLVAGDKGLGIRKADRLSGYKIRFVDNDHGIYLGDDFDDQNLSAGSLVDCHCRNNARNFTVDTERCGIDLKFFGGYWSAADTYDFDIASGDNFGFFGVNFENVSGKNNSTKDCYLKFGAVDTGEFIGISQVAFFDCNFFDNSPLADRPEIINVVSSGDTSTPSIIALTFIGNNLRSVADALFCDAVDADQIGHGITMGNRMESNHIPIPSLRWPSTQDEDGAIRLYNAQISNSQVLRVAFNRTTDFTLREAEVGKIMTNEGAPSTVNFTLPALVEGYEFYFATIENQTIQVTPNAADTILGNGGAGEYIQTHKSPNQVLRVFAVDSGTGEYWVPELLNGKWIEYENEDFDDEFPRSSGFTLRVSELGKTITNTGAGATLTLTLPDCAANPEVLGKGYTFLCRVAQAINIDPDPSDQIIGGSGAGKYMSLAGTIGNSVTIRCIESGYWMVTAVNGTLSYE